MPILPSQIPNPLLKVGHVPNKGRSFIASRALAPGSILLKVLPYAAVPDTNHKTRVCAYCLTLNTPHAFIPCTSCNIAHYCSDTCKSRDWTSQHELECSLVHSLHHEDVLDVLKEDGGDYILDFTWLLIRVLIRHCRELQGGMKQSTDSNHHMGTFADVWDMISNTESFPAARLKQFARVAQVLATFTEAKLWPLLDGHQRAGFLPAVKVDNRIDLNDIVKETAGSNGQKIGLVNQSSPPTASLVASLRELVCKEECNSFGLYTYAFESGQSPRQPYGLALYPTVVYFNHSCQPAVGHVTKPHQSQNSHNNGSNNHSMPFAGSHAEMIFFNYAQLSEGDEATISYVDVADEEAVVSNAGVGNRGDARRELLKGYFFFDCDCERCEEDGLVNSKTGSVAAATDEDNARTNNSAITVGHIVCGNKNGCRGFYIPKSLVVKDDSSSDWVCEACGYVYTHKDEYISEKRVMKSDLE
ncbi:hypothetical protein SmJEL517_g00301 [Synchytrium microbalum]|uniref:MYND-type domain-containing protein n=1 Tax=Synchytrium microbalum TaxID=1806994 RepID=A0A507CB79_9FUNG|nr:uncharacterized protein SmJEL517_g00301 [Synchytrium microbalum]TPX38317.1 hypothetical protein SmJEL517_g00301 [Synchytrium microbalum]